MTTASVQPRTMKQRQAILALLRHDGTFRTTQEIHAGLLAAGQSVGLATIYRNLGALAQLGDVDCIVQDNGETKYRHCSPEHHHHLLCRVCGKTVEVMPETFEAWCQETAQTHGFTDIEHTVEIVGTCTDCC